MKGGFYNNTCWDASRRGEFLKDHGSAHQRSTKISSENDIYWEFSLYIFDQTDCSFHFHFDIKSTMTVKSRSRFVFSSHYIYSWTSWNNGISTRGDGHICRIELRCGLTTLMDYLPEFTNVHNFQQFTQNWTISTPNAFTIYSHNNIAMKRKKTVSSSSFCSTDWCLRKPSFTSLTTAYQWIVLKITTIFNRGLSEEIVFVNFLWHLVF